MSALVISIFFLRILREQQIAVNVARSPKVRAEIVPRIQSIFSTVLPYEKLFNASLGHFPILKVVDHLNEAHECV